MRIKHLFEKRERYYTKIGRKGCDCKTEEEDEVYLFVYPSIFNESVYSLAFVALVGLAAVLITRLY